MFAGQFCNVPKKGHICPFQKVYKRATAVESAEIIGTFLASSKYLHRFEYLTHIYMLYKNTGSNSIAIQVEIGGLEMTTRVLDLSVQGTAESYIKVILLDPDNYDLPHFYSDEPIFEAIDDDV